jgi:anti-sigma factor RsiW
VNNCERIRPLLSRFAEGEADPEEAFHVARHIAGCTACKIVLARERRLHEALEDLGDSVSVVDEEFSALVMAALPAGPPPAASRPRRRGLRLAGFLTLGAVGGSLAIRALGFAPSFQPVPIAARVDLDLGSRLVESLTQIAGAAVATLARIFTGLPGPLRAAGSEIGWDLVPALAAAVFLTAGTLLVGAAWAASRRSWRVGDASPRGGEQPPERAH